MEISSNNINQPVSFYTKNTGNTINMAIDNENYLYQSNVFSAEINEQIINKKTSKTIKRKRRSKRLNTIDTDYLPDEVIEDNDVKKEDTNNFFIDTPSNKIRKNIKKTIAFFIENTPLINYFFLKQKKEKIQKAVETLSDISQNVDELMNTSIPYGEEKKLYSDIAKNLTAAANIIGKAQKKYK